MCQIVRFFFKDGFLHIMQLFIRLALFFALLYRRSCDNLVKGKEDEYLDFIFLAKGTDVYCI